MPGLDPALRPVSPRAELAEAVQAADDLIEISAAFLPNHGAEGGDVEPVRPVAGKAADRILDTQRPFAVAVEPSDLGCAFEDRVKDVGFGAAGAERRSVALHQWRGSRHRSNQPTPDPRHPWRRQLECPLCDFAQKVVKTEAEIATERLRNDVGQPVTRDDRRDRLA